MQILPIEVVFPLRQLLLVLGRQGAARILLQNDLKALHPADATQAVVDRLVKRDVHFVGNGFPRKVMKAIGENDHAVQALQWCTG